MLAETVVHTDGQTLPILKYRYCNGRFLADQVPSASGTFAEAVDGVVFLQSGSPL